MLIIITTLHKKEAATEIGKGLLKERLIACYNLFPVESAYWWKGKILEEAMKITKEDLLKKLGKVPPFKIHCSLLAADALFEAIYDYLSKKKKEIPKEFQERHQRIEKEKKIIEGRYKEWIQLEEKMHKK